MLNFLTNQSGITEETDKANTFPEPVIALPHISRPANANGMHAACG